MVEQFVADKKAKMSAWVPNPQKKFMVITPLLAIDLKATPNGNPANNFHCRKNLALSLLCNVTPSAAIIFHRPNHYI